MISQGVATGFAALLALDLDVQPRSSPSVGSPGGQRVAGNAAVDLEQLLAAAHGRSRVVDGRNLALLGRHGDRQPRGRKALADADRDEHHPRQDERRGTALSRRGIAPSPGPSRNGGPRAAERDERHRGALGDDDRGRPGVVAVLAKPRKLVDCEMTIETQPAGVDSHRGQREQPRTAEQEHAVIAPDPSSLSRDNGPTKLTRAQPS